MAGTSVLPCIVPLVSDSGVYILECAYHRYVEAVQVPMGNATLGYGAIGAQSRRLLSRICNNTQAHLAQV